MTETEGLESNIPDPNEFESDDGATSNEHELRNAFSEALTQNGFPDTLVLARERADVVFHDRRLSIMDYLSDHSPESVRALAEELGHDKGVISRDLQELARLDIVEFEESGRAKAPRLKHRHVAVEPVV
jgi:DNA-binding transcriptional ArsR family regulator